MWQRFDVYQIPSGGGMSSYLIAVGATAAAVLLRLLLDPVLGDHLTMVTMFGAVAIVVGVGGYRPALLATALGFLACGYLFIEPRGSFDPLLARKLVALSAYLVTCLIIIGLGEIMRTALRHAREQAELLRVTFASIGDAVITTDTEGRVTYLNALAESFTGWTREQAVAQPLGTVVRVVNEQTRVPVEDSAEKVLRDGGAVGLGNHIVLIAQGGTERPIEESAFPIRDAQGRIFGCVLILRDITERKRAQDEVRRFAKLVETAHDAIYARTLDGTITTWNAGAERLYGYTQEETVGRSCLMLIPPDCLDELEQMHKRLLREGQVAPFETRRVRKDGQTVFVSATLSPIKNAASQVVGIAWIGRDITARKRAEEALRREHEFSEGLVNTARTIVLVLDPEGRIVRFNPYLEELSGWRLEEVQGKNCFETFLPERERQRIGELFGRALGGERTRGNVNSIVTKEGRERVIEWFDAPLTNAQGELIGLLCTGQDITDGKRAEAALRESEARYRSLSQQLNLVTDTMSAPVVRCSRDLRYLWVSRSYAEWLGRTADEIVGRPIIDVVGAVALERLTPRIRSVLSGREVRFEEEVDLLGLGRRWVDAAYTPTFDEAGVPDGYVAVLIDINDRKRAEQALAQRVAQQAAVAALGQKALSEPSLHVLMDEVARTVAAVLGVEYCKVLELLPGGRELLLRAGVGWREGRVGHATVGAGRESQAGYTLLSAEPVIVDNLRTESRLRAAPLLSEHGVVSGMSCRIAGVAGQPFGVLGAHTSQPRHFNPEDIYFMEAVANLLGSVIQRRHFEEGLQQSEAKHRAVVDTAVDAIITIDGQGIVQTLNPAAVRMFGYATEEIIGRNVKLLMPSPYREEHDDYLTHYLATGEKRIIGIGREVIGLRKDGTTFPMELAVAETCVGKQRLFVGFIRDISERRRSEREVRDALVFAESIVETVREPLLILDGQLRVKTANRSFYRAFQVTKQDTEDQLLYDLGNGQWDIPGLRRLLEEILPEKTKIDDFEVLHEFPSIGRRVMLLNARSIYRTGKQVEMILLAIEDITERRRLEDERRELETRFTSLVKNVRDHSIFALDPRGHITTWNREAERILGFTEAEAIGQHFSIIFTPEDIQAKVPARELDVARSEGRAEDERWHLRKNGERFWALGIVSPTHDAAGQHTGFSKILRDMTDRKRIEEALQSSHARLAADLVVMGKLQQLSNRLVRADNPEGLLPSVLDAAIAISSADMGNIQLVDHDSDDLNIVASRGFKTPFLEFFNAVHHRQAACGRAMQNRERVVIEDITVSPMFAGTPALDVLLSAGVRAVQATPLVSRAGRLVGMLSTHYRTPHVPAEKDLQAIDLLARQAADWIERMEAEEELRQSHDGLEKLVAELQAKNEEVRATTQQLWQAAKLASVGELAASIAHELNNPLATMSLRLESLLDDSPPEDPNRRTLVIVQQETRRMSALVANLLQFSRRGHEQVSTVDIRHELTSTIELAYHHLKKRQVAIVQELAPDTPIIYADRQKLRQVFLNLFTNAGDAMPQGGTLTLRSRADALAGGKAAVRIEVADTGMGIPADFLEKVFDPYFTTKKEGEGTGLGLAICRRIVEEHHGTIAIESEAGMGTTVIIVLPIHGETDGESARQVARFRSTEVTPRS